MSEHVYIAGPMTGLPQFNFPAFDQAAADLREYGYTVSSPAELDDPETREAALASPNGEPGTGTANDETWGDFLSRDVKLVADEVDAVVVLPGWEKSRGARLETFCARLVGKPVYRYEDLLDSHNPLTELPSRPFALSPLSNANLNLILGYGDPGINGHGQATKPALPGIESERQVGGSDYPPPVDTAESVQANGEVRITSATGGQKGSKLARYDLIPVRPLRLLAEHYGRGAEKYADRNWEQGINWSLNYAALCRHLFAFWGGEDDDVETGSPHLVAVAWHAFAILEYMTTHPEFDDRSK